MKKPKEPPRAALKIVFSVIVFCILSITMIIVSGILHLLSRVGVIDSNGAPNILYLNIIFAIISVLIGTIVATITSGIPLKPVNELIGGLNKLASGDFKVRLKLGQHPIEKDFSNSFNILAEELQNTEILRSDFVNNFSHEFKTPIVSIRGFAKLLQKENLTNEQQEYLSIIIEESTRLSEMATNVLNLTKVENQSILTDISLFNLSEQIRDSVLLLENKWTKKSLQIVADFNEYNIEANEELLKQIWINLIDNAVKFSAEGDAINISIQETPKEIIVSFKNNGPEIKAEDVKRIFNKYWQGDTSHALNGTGIGLSIARRIAILHNGDISVISSPEETEFLVKIPIE